MAKKKELAYKREITCEIIVNSPEPAPNCFERLRESYAVMKAAYQECYQAIRAVQQKQMLMKVGELVDCQFALRESELLADDLRKEFKKLRDIMAKITCGLWITDPTSTDIVEGEYCNGHPDTKARANVPTFKKDPEKYIALMNWLGIPEDLQDRGMLPLAAEGEFETEVVRIHWSGFQDYFTRVMALGYPLPPGIDPEDTWQEAIVTIRKKFDLL